MVIDGIDGESGLYTIQVTEPGPRLIMPEYWANQNHPNMHGFRVVYVNDINPDRIRYMDFPVELPVPGGTYQMHPRKVVDYLNNVHVVWMESDDLAFGWKIMYAELNSVGGLVAGPVQLSDTAAYNAVYPTIDVDSMNDSHVAWVAQQTAGGQWEIFYSKVAATTALDLTIPDQQLSDDNSAHSGRPIMALTDDGTTTLYIEHPDIAVDTVDDVHVVWSDRRDGHWEVYYQKQNSMSFPMTLINDTRVSDLDDYMSFSPALDTGRDDNVHIAWQDQRGGEWEIYYQQQDATGVVTVNDTPISGPLDTYDSAVPDLAAENGPDAEDDFVHVAFMDRRAEDPGHEGEGIHLPDTWEIFSTILNSAGGTAGWGVPKRQSDLFNSSTVYGIYTGPPDNHSMYPQIACEDSHQDGDTFIKWHDLRDGNWEIYETEVHNWCNNPNTDIRVTFYGLADMYPAIALDDRHLTYDRNPDNKWQRYDGSEWDIINARKEMDEWIETVFHDDRFTRRYTMFPDPWDYDASPTDDGIRYMVGRPLPSEHLNGMFRVEVRDASGLMASTPWVPLTLSNVDDDGTPPRLGRVELDTGVPNPFNPSTSISYYLVADGHVVLEIFDLRGQLVATLVNEDVAEGSHEVIWDGRDRRGVAVASGAYIARVEALGEVVTTKIMLAR
jgi:hypothetical protein